MTETPDINFDSIYNHMVTPGLDSPESYFRHKLDSLDLEEFVCDIKSKRDSG
jgi:hypothetical protein